VSSSDPPGPVRDCVHPRARHVHGTRSAYVADRCRCQACREANRRDARARSRAIAYGRWQPYVDAGPVREHVRLLRAAGLGIDRIVAISGVGSGTVRLLVYGDREASAGRRLRATTAERLLAVEISGSGAAGGALCDATQTHLQLRSLLAAGWTWAHLGELLQRDPASLRASLRRPRVRVRTATAVAELHRRLLSSHRPQPGRNTRGTALHQPAARTALYAQQHVDPDDSKDELEDELEIGGEDLDDVDEVAVEQAMQGCAVSLTAGEEREAIERLTRQGRSLRQIAALLHTSPRTVSRRRTAARAA
jgi:hypothetical protein